MFGLNQQADREKLSVASQNQGVWSPAWYDDAQDPFAPIESGAIKSISALMEGAVTMATPYDENLRGAIIEEKDKYVEQKLKELRPDPQTTGFLGQLIYGFLDLGTTYALGGPLTAGYAQAKPEYVELKSRGVDEQTALGVSATTGITTTLSGVLPASVPGSLATRILSGVGINVPMGVAQRGISKKILEDGGYSDMAKQYEPFDAAGIIIDGAFGAIFGGISGHGGKPREQIKDKVPVGESPANAPVSDVDALLAANDIYQLELDSPPGIPTNYQTRNSHISAMLTATEQLLSGQAVDVRGVFDEVKGNMEFALNPEGKYSGIYRSLSEGLRRAGEVNYAQQVDRLLAEANAQYERRAGKLAEVEGKLEAARMELDAYRSRQAILEAEMARPLQTSEVIKKIDKETGERLEQIEKELAGAALSGKRREELQAEARMLTEGTNFSEESLSGVAKETRGLLQKELEQSVAPEIARLEKDIQRYSGEVETRRSKIRGTELSGMSVSLSAATKTIPGINKLWDAAKQGDIQAHKALNQVAMNSLERLFGGLKNVSVRADYNTGLYGGTVEPSLGLKVDFQEDERPQVLAALAKFAENFDQEQVHVRSIATDENVNGQYPDGSYNTPYYRIYINSALSKAEIENLIEKSGLYGLTFNNNYIEAYFVGDAKDAAAVAEFTEGAQVIIEALGGNAAKVEEDVQRLWAYGRGKGAIPYERISGDLRPQKAGADKTARLIAERYLGGNVTGREQAGRITPEQDRIQSEIADEYDALPLNDIENPLVRKAYSELAKEVVGQFEALPLKKIDIWVGKGEPYKDSEAMRRDVQDNNHIFIYKTDPTTFGPEGVEYKNHPLLEETDFKAADPSTGKEQVLLVNDLLRAVHDYFAHNITATQFGPLGEEAAWYNHMITIKSPWARWALTSETRGQNSWVNFNRGLDRSIPIKERPFAIQKAALLPIERVLTGDNKVDAPILQLMKKMSPEQRLGSLNGVDVPEVMVRQDIERKLLSIGVSKEEAKVNSEVQAAYYKARADLFGGKLGTAEDVYNRSNLEVKKGITTDIPEEGWILNQPLTEVFYSGLHRAVESAKLAKGTGEQWFNTIKNLPGVKPEELQWTGLEKWLPQQEVVLTKDELLSYLRENAVVVEERVLTEDGVNPDEYIWYSVVETIEPDWETEAEPYLDDVKARYEQEIKDEQRLPEEMPSEADMLEEAIEVARETYDWDRAEKIVDFYYNDTSYRAQGHDDYGWTVDIDGREIHVNYLEDIESRIREEVYNDSEDVGVEYDSYVLPGKRGDYKEILFTLPELENRYNIPHFGRVEDANVFAHARISTRYDAEGNRVLFIDEIQSDWHQAGRSQGFKLGPEERERLLGELDKLNVEIRDVSLRVEELEDKRKEQGLLAEEQTELTALKGQLKPLVKERDKTRANIDSQIPNAPFKSNAWAELVIKRLLRYAADYNFSKVGWITGEQANEINSLQRAIRGLTYFKKEDGNYNISVEDHGGLIHTSIGRERLDDIEEKDLVMWFGEEVANKIIAGEGTRSESSGDLNIRKLEGLDIVAQKGHKSWYNEIVRNIFSKTLKKYGVKPATLEIRKSEETRYEFKEISEEQEAQVRKDAVALFKEYYAELPDTLEHTKANWKKILDLALEKDGSGNYKEYFYRVINTLDRIDSPSELSARAQALIKTVRTKVVDTVTVHGFEMNAALTEGVRQGQPLFQENRGQIQLGDTKKIITLFEKADASTFSHEMGHLWLEELRVDVRNPDAPQSLKDDFKTVLDYLGAKEGEELTVEQHEKWSTTVEQYLMEGKAPTLKLMEAFQKLKDWLIGIYKGVAINADINDEIRGVLDRLLGKQEPKKDNATSKAAREVTRFEQDPTTFSGEITKEKPDMMVVDDDGNVISAKDLMAQVDMDIAKAQDESRLYEVAANCFLRFGDAR